MAQIVLALVQFQMVGGMHNDLHLGNVFLKMTARDANLHNKANWHYKLLLFVLIDCPQ